MILPKPSSKLFQKATAVLFVLFLILPTVFFFSKFTNTVSAGSNTQLLSSSWTLSGNNGASEKSQIINSAVLAGNDTLQLTYNLHGLKLLGGDASAIILEQPNGTWHYVSLANYGQNGYDGVQTVNIPLSAFPGLSLSQSLGTFHVRFWYWGPFTVDISSALITSSTATPSPTPIPTPTSSPVPVLTGTQLLTNPWNISGSKGAVEKYQSINQNVLQGQTTLSLTYNLHGFKLWKGDASAIIFDQGGSWHYVPLANYGQNGLDGIQTVNIPLSAFPGLNLTQPVGNFHVRFWSPSTFNIDITSARVYGAGSAPLPTPISSPTPTPTATPAPAPATGSSWAIQSVSSMKETKDKLCGQDSQTFINQWIAKAKNLGVNYVAVETPYDSPSCGDSLAYTRAWIGAIRAAGMKVWHRHMPLAFEGIYSITKTRGDYLNMISAYIKNNPALFAEGDIFTPIPEPQNGGISGITYCAQNVCQFNGASEFNSWLRNAMTTSEGAFQTIGMGGKMKIGYYGFDGFVAWGDNNPDWDGILEDATVKQMGNITIDHYPQLINSNMQTDLQELEARYPGVPIIIGEWGTVGTTDKVQQVKDNMAAARRPSIVGFNYWHMGMGGNEALINSDFSETPQYSAVQSYFKNTI